MRYLNITGDMTEHERQVAGEKTGRTLVGTILKDFVVLQ